MRRGACLLAELLTGRINTEKSGVVCHMMESSALRTMYLTPKYGMSSETQRRQLKVPPAICKFLPMIEAGLPAAAQIWEME